MFLAYGEDPYAQGVRGWEYQARNMVRVGTLALPECGGMLPSSGVAAAESKPKAVLRQGRGDRMKLTMTARLVAPATVFKVSIDRPGRGRIPVKSYSVASGEVEKRTFRSPVGTTFVVRAKVPVQYGVRQYRLTWKTIERRTAVKR